jgi:asparagine synthase (glutamine-hydrolysing)
MPWTGAYYAEELAAGQWRSIYGCLRDDCRELGIGEAFWWFFRYGLTPLLPEAMKKALRIVLKGKRRASWLSTGFQEIFEIRRNQFQVSVPRRFNRRGQSTQTTILLGAYDALGRELEERLSSSLRLELRKPFFNEKIVQFAFSTPERFRSKGHATKWLHRQAMKGLLPDTILNRTTKADFMVAFRRQLDTMKAELMDDIVPRRAAWIQTERAATMCKDYRDDEFAGWAEWWLWTLVGCDGVSSDR